MSHLTSSTAAPAGQAGLNEAASKPLPAPSTEALQPPPQRATTEKAPVPVVRRGRGTFKHQLRTEEMERQYALGATAASAAAAAALGRAEEASTAFTAATTHVVLPSSMLGSKATKPATEEEEIAAQFAHLKKGKDIPLNMIPAQLASSAAAAAAAAAASAGGSMSVTARLIAAAEARAAAPRTHFGIFENNATDTARQLLFRGEKRRRYCVIIGDLQNSTRQVTLKLFGHKGAKPFKLQNKLIRLVNLSVGKPRRGTLQWREAHGLLDEDDDDDDEEQPEEHVSDSEGEQKQGQKRESDQDSVVSDMKSDLCGADSMDKDGEDADDAAVTEWKDKKGDASPTGEAPSPGAPSNAPLALGSMPTGLAPTAQAIDVAKTAEERAFQNQTHAAAGFDVEEVIPSSSCSSCEGGDDDNARKEARRRKASALAEAVASMEKAARAVPIPETDSDADDDDDVVVKKSGAEIPLEDGHSTAPAPLPVLSAEVKGTSPKAAGGCGVEGSAFDAAHVDPVAPETSTLPAKAAPAAAEKHLSGSPHHHSKGTDAEGEDVDHYLDNDDEVVPLTVQQAGTGASVMYEMSLANSPVLTAKRFSSLRDYFLREFRFLFNLEDVRTQHVSVKINLGAAYCCLARQGSYSTPLKHATFGEFVERMNTESMQLYFIKDCPACVSRAVDMESGSLHFPASSTTVKINFFSNERQSRSIARAVWDSDVDQFCLLDVENIGVTFNWSVFSLDETFVRRKNEGHDAEEEGAGSGSAGTAGESNKNHIASAVPVSSAASASSPATATAALQRSSVAMANEARMRPAPVGMGMDLEDPFQESIAAAPAQINPTNGASAAVAPAIGEETKNLPKVSIDDDEDDLARNKTVAYPFEVELRAYRRWKQQGDNPAAPLAKAILEELSLAEHNYLIHGSTDMYERMDLTNVCEVDYAAEDLNVESIVVEHTSRVKPEGTDLLVDNTTSLFIENFAAARQLKEKVATYGPVKVAAMQNPSNNNFMRSLTAMRRATGRNGSSRGARDALQLTPAEMTEVLKPTSKLTFFRSRGSTIHWKLRPNSSLEENIAPMTEALSFLQQVLHTANEIERNSARGGAAPDAL